MGKENKGKVKMLPQLYKGHKSYINYLGRFVGVFEDVINKQLTSENELKKRFPRSAQYFKNTIKKSVAHSTSDDLGKVLKRTGISLAYNGANCLLYELCRHIRNSFCHLLLEADGENLNILDQSRGKLTSKGGLPKKILIDFVKMIVNEYEDSYK